MKNKKTILLVEDDYVDAITAKRALKELNINNPVQLANNGEEALKHLRNCGPILPAIILLDLNMPKMNGLEFLEVLKNDKNLRATPVIILTTSRNEEDRRACFHFGAAGYMIKPVDYKVFLKTMQSINDYWSLSELP